MRLISFFLALLLALSLASAHCAAETAGTDAPVVVLRVRDYGDIYLELYPDLAPITVDNFLKLIDSGFYNGLTFHRIISGFMAQGGCPLGNGTGNSGTSIKGEFSSNGVDNPLKHERGVLSMARSSDPDSASCQFFIMHDAATHLDGNYAAFGRVIAGMGAVDSMCQNAHVTDQNGTVPKEDQPEITEAARADRAEAEAAAAREAENGSSGGIFDDPATGVAFRLPEGWSLAKHEDGVYSFTDGTSEILLLATDLWRQLGKSVQEQYAAQGYNREVMTTALLARSAFAGTMGTTEDQLTEQVIDGVLWLTASLEKEGKMLHYRACAIRGTIVLFAADDGPAVQAMESIISTLTVE